MTCSSGLGPVFGGLQSGGIEQGVVEGNAGLDVAVILEEHELAGVVDLHAWRDPTAAFAPIIHESLLLQLCAVIRRGLEEADKVQVSRVDPELFAPRLAFTSTDNDH